MKVWNVSWYHSQYSQLIAPVIPISFVIQAGLFDPFSDDPRLGITQIVMCPLTGKLLLGGSAGQVMYFHLEEKEMVRRVDVSIWFGLRLVAL